MSKRTIIFGDVHACHEEWQDLMTELKVTDKDRLISVGDLVAKGPNTKKTLDLAMSLPNLECVVGNHELHLLKYWKKIYTERPMKDYQVRAFDELGDDLEKYMTYLDSWPYYIEDGNFLVIHGGLVPGLKIEEQDPENLVSLRTVGEKPWHSLYTGEKLVIYGHWAMQGLHKTKNTIGLDSGCVYGKKLSAVILPEREIVSVPARKVHVQI